MAVILVTYDLKKPGRNYAPVHEYLKRFTHCKGMESVWLLDTSTSCVSIRDNLNLLVDANDVVFVTPIARGSAWLRYPCGDWLLQPGRNW